jgi:hypothetical protein
LGTNGSREITNILKEKISSFLKEKLSLKLSENKTLITKIYENLAKFLDFELSVSPRGPLYRKPTGNLKFKKFNLRRKVGGLYVWSVPDRNRMINRLYIKGFCTENGTPKELPWLSCFEPQIIVQRYNSIILGLANFYMGYTRNKASICR